MALLFLPDLEVFDFRRDFHATVQGLGREVVAHQCDVAVQGYFLVEHLQRFETAATGFDVGDEGFLVLNLPARMPVSDIVRGQRVEGLDVLVQHRLSHRVDGLGDILLVRRRGGGGIARKQA